MIEKFHRSRGANKKFLNIKFITETFHDFHLSSPTPLFIFDLMVSLEEKNLVEDVKILSCYQNHKSKKFKGLFAKGVCTIIIIITHWCLTLYCGIQTFRHLTTDCSEYTVFGLTDITNIGLTVKRRNKILGWLKIRTVILSHHKTFFF